MQQRSFFAVLLPEVALTDDRTKAGSMCLAGMLLPMPALGKGCLHCTATCTQGASHVTGGLLTGGHAGRPELQSGLQASRMILEQPFLCRAEGGCAHDYDNADMQQARCMLCRRRGALLLPEHSAPARPQALLLQLRRPQPHRRRVLAGVLSLAAAALLAAVP